MKRRLRNIISAFSVSFVIMAALSVYSIEQFTTLTGYSDAVDHTNQVITSLYKIDNSIRAFDTKERDYILTRDAKYAKDLISMSRSIMPELVSLKKLIRNDSIQYKTLTLLRAALTMRYADFRDNIALIDTAHNFAQTPYLYKGTQRRNECISYITKMIHRENILLQQRFEGKRKYQQTTSDTIRYLIIIFGIVTAILFLLMVNELAHRMRYQNELQTKLADLKRSHTELEQIAFAASHDLQEPLRKIRMFGNRLLYLRRHELDEESKDTVERINIAATRMQGLIEDMVNLTSLINEDGEKSVIDLNLIMKNVMSELADTIEEKKAAIHYEVLPEIHGYERQMNILFKSLIDNSLKFSRPGVSPVINIRVDKTTGNELEDIDASLARKTFFKITIADNGIGFDNKFTSKMFQIFQTLHTEVAGYEGQGIGLAICQRIMVNHTGYIMAHGHIEVGATFKLFFPAE